MYIIVRVWSELKIQLGRNSDENGGRTRATEGGDNFLIRRRPHGANDPATARAYEFDLQTRSANASRFLYY